jgi:type II secretion system protein G
MKAEGVTLIELIVVCAIISILAAIAVPNFLSLLKEAAVAKAIAEANTIKSASSVFKADCSLWPQATSDLITAPQTCPQASWQGPYINQIQDDPWHNAFSYGIPEFKTAVYIWSWGPNGINEQCASGSDDICIIIHQ